MSISTYGWGIKSITTLGFGANPSAILVGNFSIDVEEWVSLSSLTSFCVDVFGQASCPISTSGTHFIIDDLSIATTYSGIDDGYRFCCSAPTTISGAITVIIHIENECGEVKEQDFNLLFGYRVEFTEYTDWGPNQSITVWSSAGNEVVCPNTETFATYFQTKDLESRNLGAYIYPTGSADLGAEIVPQTKAFLPGFSYRITVSGIKDYSGNEMDTIEFNFIIEDT